MLGWQVEEQLHCTVFWDKQDEVDISASLYCVWKLLRGQDVLVMWYCKNWSLTLTHMALCFLYPSVWTGRSSKERGFWSSHLVRLDFLQLNSVTEDSCQVEMTLYETRCPIRVSLCILSLRVHHTNWRSGQGMGMVETELHLISHTLQLKQGKSSSVQKLPK